MDKEIKVGEWVFLKSNPEVKFRAKTKDSNGIMNIREITKEPPFHVYPERDLERVIDQKTIDDLELREVKENPPINFL